MSAPWQMEVQVKRRGAFQKAYVSSYGEIPKEVFGENAWEHRLAQLLPKMNLGICHIDISEHIYSFLCFL